ncbi:MAG: GFA family protein [Hyphomicrobiales bacterium]|nr:GFA family protein [Acidobacteriaceae bacterium]MBV9137041.1 GFA family protein [Hyphomicrobiales bacterium]MBV9750989.1 GFA family protein [Hyphomicrobiales bacterium]
MFTGGCLCEGVRYRVMGKMSDISLCHCSQCARTSGHIDASAVCAADALALEKARTLRWYRISEIAERGFCSNCGGNLFWRRVGSDVISVMAGTLDRPTGLRLKHHIYCASRSDYDEIQDQLPQYAAEAEAD